MPNDVSCPDRHELEEFHLGGISSERSGQIRVHLSNCESCRQQLRRMEEHGLTQGTNRAQSTLNPNTNQPSSPHVSRTSCLDDEGKFAGSIPLEPAQQPGELGRLGEYSISKELGRGGMGVVYLAEDLQLQRQVALKVMLPELAQQAEARERLLREARAAAAIESDHILSIYQVGQSNGVPFLAMPLLQGESLDSWMRSHTLTVAEIVRIGREIAQGLAAAHERGMVHRDIKPSNIWLDSRTQNRVKILDFGLARTEHEVRLTQPGQILGTPSYMAPEQARGGNVDGRADLFALGCVLYRLCAGHVPFQGKHIYEVLLALTSHTPPPLDELNPAIPQKLSNLVTRLLAKDVEARPKSANEVVAILQEIEQREWNNTLPIRVSEPESRPAREGSTTGLSAPRSYRWVLWVVPILVFALGGMYLAGLDHSFFTGRNDRTAKPDGSDAQELPTTFKLDLANGVAMEFVLVPKGTFWMSEETNNAQKKVQLATPFYIGKFEVTQQQWQTVMGDNPSAFSRTGYAKYAVVPLDQSDLDRFPVENVTWEECQQFLEKLNDQYRDRAWMYRLPTEAEWEFSCRGGEGSKEVCSHDFYLQTPTDSLSSRQANFNGKLPAGEATFGPYLMRPTMVGTYKPNSLGIYDMHGNVFEWCDDWFDVGQSKQGDFRVCRGGSWYTGSNECKAAHRYPGTPSFRHDFLGFRVVRVPAEDE